MKKVVITGANGFLGRNLLSRLIGMPALECIPVAREDSTLSFQEKVRSADFIFHFAAAIRPQSVDAFQRDNVELTEQLVHTLSQCASPASVIFSSSTQAEDDSDYGRSKREAEELLAEGSKNGLPVKVYRFPGIFGRWGKPNFNSVVATFCHNASRGLPLVVHDPFATLRLVYVEDVVDSFIADLEAGFSGLSRGEVAPDFEITVGRLATLIRGLRDNSMETDTTGLSGRLRQTYRSYAKGVHFATS